MPFGDVYILFGALFAIVLSVAYAIGTKKSSGGYILAGTFLSISVVQLDIYYFGIILPDQSYIFLDRFAVPVAYTLGPFLFLYFTCLTSDKFKLRPYHLSMLLPSVVSGIYLAPYYISSDNFKLKSYLNRNARSEIMGPMYHIITEWGIPLSILLFLGYFVWSHRSSATPGQRKSYPIILANFILGGIIVGCLISIFKSLSPPGPAIYQSIEEFVAIANTTGIVCFFWLTQRKPALTFNRDLNFRKDGLRKNSRTIQILGQLESLMKWEKIYTDPDLTLAKVAKDLSISPRNLTQLLNNELGKNFNNYINEFRIMEAQALLAGLPKMTVMEIAKTVGFKSKSAFYSAFESIANMSPKEYRLENRKRSQ